MNILDDEIVSIEEIGEMPVYDIMMAQEPHNFIANDVVVHNCKAHAIAYSIIGYRCAWYKRNYPNEFLVANIKNPKSNNKFTESEYISEFIKEAREMGIKVSLPKIGKCEAGPFYDPIDDCVYLGLASLKGMTEKPATVIIEAAKLDNFTLKEFCDYCFAQKVTTDKLTKAGKVIERVIITKSHIKTLLSIGFLGDSAEKIAEYNKLYKGDLEIIDSEDACNQVLGFDFYSPFEKFKKQLDLKYSDISKYLIAKVLETKSGQNAAGYKWNLVKFETEKGQVTSFFKKPPSGLVKSQWYVLQYNETKKGGDSIEVTDFKSLE